MTVEIILEVWTLRYEEVKNDLLEALQPVVVFFPLDPDLGTSDFKPPVLSTS